MFSDCENMTGTLTSLPSALQCGYEMFYYTPKLTGSPAKPEGLTYKNSTGSGGYSGMFGSSGVMVDWD